MLASDYEARISVAGQKSDLFPIPPSRLKARLEAATPEWLASAVLGRLGFFLVVEGVKRDAEAPGLPRP
jgi:hypothetical protein